MTSFPYNASVALHTTQNIARAMQLYAFRDIAKAPPAPFAPPVDLDKALAALGTTPFETDFEFQQALRAVFLQLHDAHTNVYAPTPYAAFTFLLPLNLFAYANEQGQLTLEVSEVFNNASAWAGLDVASLVGATVVSIDSQKATDFVIDFATNHVGSSKDPQTRFNIALLQRPPLSAYGGAEVPWPGLLTWRPHHFALTPLVAGHTFEIRLANGTTVQQHIEFKALPLRSFASTEEYVASYWASSSSSAGGEAVQKKPSLLLQKKKNAQRMQPLFNNTEDGVGFYLLRNDTLVWYQNNFEPANYAVYYQTVIDGLLYAQQQGVTKLILDFSMNGGGDICLGRSMLQILFPTSPNFGPSDMPATPLAVNLTASAAVGGVNGTEWSPDFYLSAINQASFGNASWLVPGIARVRGNVPGNYSQLIMITSAGFGCGIPPVQFTASLFDAKNIVFLSRGFCGSTCALFADSLHDYQGIRTVVAGGYDATLGQSYRSFPGLQVVESAEVYSLLDALLQNTGDQTCLDCLAPRRLLTTAAFRICIREVYKNVTDTDTPLEYVQQNADEHIQFTRQTALDPEMLWSSVIDRFLDEN